LPKETRESPSQESSQSKATRFNTFRALRYTSFRYMWLGQLGHSAAMWMEQVVRPLLIYELTGSALQVGLVVAVRVIPQFVFGLLAGVVADRYDKRRILIISQTITLLMHLTLALLILSGQIKIWQIFVTAFISGGSMAFNQPARQSLVPRLVPGEILLNAVALNTSAMNIMRVMGAALAGVILLFLDYGQVYLLNGAFFVGVIWTTARIKVLQDSAAAGLPPGKRPSLFDDFREGFRYVNRNRKVLYLVGTAMVIFILGYPYQQVFVPLLALNVLDIGRAGAGWMRALTGAGALIGSLVLASIERLRRRGMLLLACAGLFSLALVLLARTTAIPFVVIALILCGSMSTGFNALNTSLLLEETPRGLHGRVMSLMSLDRGMMSVGAILAGSLAEALGPQSGLTVIAAALIAILILMFAFIPSLRRIG